MTSIHILKNKIYSQMLGSLSQVIKQFLVFLFTYCLEETYSKMSAYRKVYLYHSDVLIMLLDIRKQCCKKDVL